MSLDQLPNELIAHIGSFLNFEDNIQFGLCQKRIHTVLKRDGLLKPECETLRINDVVLPRGVFTLTGSTWMPIEEETKDPKFNSLVGQVINKFRKIENIEFYDIEEKLTENVLKDLINTKNKLSSLTITDAEIDAVDPNIFIAACKNFDNIDLETKLPPELLCDQVFVELMPKTTFFLKNSENGPLDGYFLTDRTLKALSEHKENKHFDISEIFTSFTIAGIKTLVEELLKAEYLEVIYDLGILKFSEGRNMVHWTEEVAADPNCQYRIEREDPVLPERAVIPYSINVKNDTHREIYIQFAINRVEV